MTTEVNYPCGIGDITCKVCDVTYELGENEDEALRVMDRFFAKHTHSGGRTSNGND